jgi:hypothetical protein
MSLFDDASLIVTPNGVKEGKLYSIKPSDGSGDLSVTRATTATRVNSAGLVELVPVNLASYSEQFDNGYWSKFNNSVSANATTSPNGTLTADKEIPNTSNDIHGIIRNVGSFESSIYTASVYLKKSEYNFGWVRLTTNSDAQKYAVVINLTTGVMTTTNSSGSPVSTNYTIEQLPNDWFRLSVSMAHNSGDIYFMFGSCPTATPTFASTIPSFAGDGTSGIFAWGGQLVQGSSAKDYYPTTTRLNIPRLDYTNGTCPSILVEPQRTNLLTYSNDYNDASWQKPGLTISLGTQVNPQGIASTYSISNTTLGDSYLQKTGLSTTAGNYTMSVFVKNIDNVTSTQLMAVHLTEGSVTSELTYTWATNTFVLSGTNAISGSSVSYANGWVRLTFTYSIGALTTLHWSRLYANRDLAVTKSILVYGFQCESGSYATSYVPTQNSSVTRNADVISKTGISSLIGQTEGTVFWDIYIDTISATNNENILNIDNGFFGTTLYFIKTAIGTLGAELYNGGVVQFSSSTSITQKGRYKCALAYKTNDFALYINGVQIGTDSSGTIGAMSRLQLGQGVLGASVGNTNSVVLWKERLDNATLATLTTI